ncbi:MAG: DUF3164 family protein [Sulfuricellaceae bacterium]
MTTFAPKGYLRDEAGRFIPIGTIHDIDLMRDKLVRDLIGCAKEHSLALAEFKRAAFDDIAAFAQISAEQYGARVGGTEGNLTLYSYDRRYKIQRAIAKTIAFGEQLQAAKALIDECIHDWSEGSQEEAKVLLNAAFQTDQKGNVNTARILDLRRHKFRHPKWQKAMQAINDAIITLGSKSYVRLYERSPDGEYHPISLDVAVA